ncbi:hypothetical protein, partial [Desulfosporosinus fructosivorans]
AETAITHLEYGEPYAVTSRLYGSGRGGLLLLIRLFHTQKQNARISIFSTNALYISSSNSQ